MASTVMPLTRQCGPSKAPIEHKIELADLPFIEPDAEADRRRRRDPHYDGRDFWWRVRSSGDAVTDRTLGADWADLALRYELGTRHSILQHIVLAIAKHAAESSRNIVIGFMVFISDAAGGGLGLDRARLERSRSRVLISSLEARKRAEKRRAQSARLRAVQASRARSSSEMSGCSCWEPSAGRACSCWE